MSNEIIERVAKAIQDCPFPATNEDKAKAAIAAMRDLVKCNPDGNAADDRIVNEYIDAALKE